ncbi:hypothetical protein BDQ12DRAFT_375673 [Crucibulum laeve]|uniref:RING-type domain-containing protein n=1 Tax=Crucibulum laeve TaxID=68775 RepID=A0A5C3LMR4_9AGAR|nr:hypothetical protein BDQ12DRAFT_375673 [Crucibulum laeve]
MPFTISFPSRHSLHYQHLNFPSSSSPPHSPSIDHVNYPPKSKPSCKCHSSTLTLSSPLLCGIEETPEDEYDIGQLNLGAESPALALEESASADGVSRVEASGVAGLFMGDVETRSRLFLSPAQARSSLADARRNLAARPTSLAGRRPAIPRRRSWRSTGSALARESNNSAISSTTSPKKSRQSAADRDCGICFEYAVSPCRTLCCGKMFCKEHIVDWLHGPSSDGRCPACEKPCSVDRGVLSLASPALLPTTGVNGNRRDSVMTERTRIPSRSLATRRMSTTSTGSSSSASSSNSSNSATAPSEAESPITSDDEEPPRYSKHPPPMYSTVNVSTGSWVGGEEDRVAR